MLDDGTIMKQLFSRVSYARAGGTNSLSEYYTSTQGEVIFRSSLKENLLFSQHNLAMEGSFNEFHLILCRNVMIYFTKPLQQRVHQLLFESLSMFGVLGIGSGRVCRAGRRGCPDRIQPGRRQRGRTY